MKMSSNTGYGFTSPTESASFIVTQSEDVTISDDGIQSMALMLWKKFSDGVYDVSVWRQHPLHPKEANELAIDWIFLVDSLNFSFWTSTEQSNTKYVVRYLDEDYTGYWALCAAVMRALDDNVPITDPAFYTTITESDMKHIFRSETQVDIPLLRERMDILHQNGRVLLDKFDGHFVNCLKLAHGSAIDLLKLVMMHFVSFRDECPFHGRTVSFHKRGQILIADIWGCFGGNGLGSFHDINALTMFADYRVPQVLVYFGALTYSDRLKERLNTHQEFMYGDPLEVEIRGGSIQAVQQIEQRMQHIASQEDGKKPSPLVINSILIDFYLWDYRRSHSKQIDECIPFHKVRCTFY